MLSRRTCVGVEYFLLRDPVGVPAPTLLHITAAAHVLLETDWGGRLGHLLSECGWLVASVDAPCHGADRRDGEPPELAGWRARLDRGEALVEPFCERASAVLDILIAAGDADPDRLAVSGLSRGGFLALHFAASDPRVRAVAALSPVTDLLTLREFSGMEQHAPTRRLALSLNARALAGTALWISIGHDDLRVGTRQVMELYRRISEETLAAGVEPRHELHIIPTPGHGGALFIHDMAAQWLCTQLQACSAAE